MGVAETQNKQQSELHSKLWSMANDLRGSMDASEFKNYILGLIFYRFLSEKLVNYIEKNLLKEDKISYEEAWKKDEYRKAIIEDLIKDSDCGYVIEPQYLFSNLIHLIETGNFDISILNKAIGKLQESTYGNESQQDFENLFEDMDLNSSKLGRGEAAKSRLIGTIMQKINDIDFKFEDTEIDVLGDAYEYLIGQFAASAGKKAGEYYTPQQVSNILAQIVTIDNKDIKNVYDPTCGSGSLLLRVAKQKGVKVSSFFGQEKVGTTYNLARMNMLLHNVPFNRFDIFNGDTLENPKQEHMKMRFQAIVANPPYSAKWSADEKFNTDERFSAYGKLAPKSKADYAFIQHMIYLLDDNGTMAVVLPHGVLFRGASEGTIRKYLVEEKNYLDAVIGLPANIFYGTSIPTCILVFKKCKKHDNVLFIDASKDFEPGKNQNRLRDEDIEKIIKTYKDRKEIEKYSHVATMEEIKENECNLNIPRYVDTFEEEEEIDIDALYDELEKIDKEDKEVTEELNKYLKELGLKELK